MTIVRYLSSKIGAYLEFYEFLAYRVRIGSPDSVPSEIIDVGPASPSASEPRNNPGRLLRRLR
ncbi:MAG: hypothetical protein ABSD49_11590 [Candidatus Bathyarchaeia archaeon]